MSLVTGIGVGAMTIGVAVAGATAGPGPVRLLAEAGQMRPQIVSEATAQQEEKEFGKGAYRVGTEGLVMPKLIKQVDPRYTRAALRAKVEGTVELELVVAADGRVEDARVIKKLHEELDEQALATVTQWEFEPGRLNDEAVRVVVTTQVMFRLH